MSDYTIIENLSEDEILNLYDEIIEISAYQYHCLCTCNDGYRANYTCINNRSCVQNIIYGNQTYYRCYEEICKTHGGQYSLMERPDEGDECCQSGNSCWRNDVSTIW